MVKLALVHRGELGQPVPGQAPKSCNYRESR
jgi:hypothetical protein